MNGLETSLYELTRLFLLPVLLLILAALAYAFVALGGFAMEAWQRRRGRYRSRLAAWQALHGGNSDDLELWIMQRLEWLRITSRSAPMLGLVATMIPMGPALLALTRNDAQGIGENLVVAFSAVILALVAASITFFILTVRRRWLLQELRAVERAGGRLMRFLEHDEADDPILSMVNLIDLFLVVIGILLIVIVQNPLNPFSQDKVVVVENPGEADMRMLVKDGKELKRYQASGEIGEGQGSRAGVTYRLADGRMIYVPESGGEAGK